MFDIVFISYQESNADKNWERLVSRFPYAKRIHGIKGIHQAHIEAAKQCSTDMFWVVDGDAVIEDTFNFDYEPEHLDFVYVWRSRNPVNDLVYGNGGVKLLPRLMTENMDISKPDMTTSISTKFKPILELSNVTEFNTDEFNTWKSAFRECCKLSSKVIDRQKSDETEQRLNVWCTAGADRPYGEWAIKGAVEGRAYGEANRGNLDALKMINDFDWLRTKFNGDDTPTILSEKQTGNISWLHGLEDFLNFADEDIEAAYVRNFLSFAYADDLAFVLKKLIITAHERTTDAEDFNRIINFFLAVFELANKSRLNEDMDLIEWNKVAKILFPDQKLFNVLHKYFRNYGDKKDAISDAFSRSQVQSKIWLVNELKKVSTHFDTTYILAGWFGQLRLYFDAAGINYNKIRILDIDPAACKVSDQIFNVGLINNYQVKSAEADLNDMSWLSRTGCEYNLKNYNTDTLVKEKSIPNLIINTSAEHFHERWYHKFVNRPLDTDPLFVIQSNNLFAVEDHINAISSLKEMHIKFPMSRIEYAGELQLSGYKRFMLIGRP